MKPNLLSQHRPELIEIDDFPKYPDHYYDQFDTDKEFGDWIPTKIREEFIKNFRLKKNLEIKFTKGYDLYKERLTEWKNSTPKMKEDYEEMKKDAQVEEYKFMEKIMNQFEFQSKEQQIKHMINEIKQDKKKRVSHDGQNIEQVKDLQKSYQESLVQLYQE
jgi:hypothetical protein